MKTNKVRLFKRIDPETRMGLGTEKEEEGFMIILKGAKDEKIRAGRKNRRTMK